MSDVTALSSLSTSESRPTSTSTSISTSTASQNTVSSPPASLSTLSTTSRRRSTYIRTTEARDNTYRYSTSSLPSPTTLNNGSSRQPPAASNTCRGPAAPRLQNPSRSRRHSLNLHNFSAAAAKRIFTQAIARTLSSNSKEGRPEGGKRRSRTMASMANRHSIAGPIGPIGGGISGIPSHAASVESIPRHSNDSPSSATSLSRPSFTSRRRSNSWHAAPERGSYGYTAIAEKPLASTSGGSVTMTIALAEPVLFLQGFDHSDAAHRSHAMLRGSLIVRVTKPTKMKAITLTFKGRARTEWPEGIPPKKNEFFEEEDIMTHTWTFFNAQFGHTEGHGADCARIEPHRENSGKSIASVSSRASSASIVLGPKLVENRRLSLQSNKSKSLSREDALQSSTQQRGYRLFLPGEYIYNFELPIESCLPETIAVDLGSVKYELDAVIERAGAFRPKLQGKKEVVLIRAPAEGSLECTEPIAINRNWDDQLQYDIVISGKSFPLGSKIPIAFRLTPLAKVRCHRIRVYITENIEYFCQNKKVHRLDPIKKVQLFEKRADGPTTSAFKGSSVRILAGGGYTGSDPSNPKPDSSDNLLGDLTNNFNNAGPTEMEFNVQLPGCSVKEKDKIHFDTTYKNIQVHHWIKIVMRLSKQDPNDPNKRRHFEISIDSPLQILSCRATHTNTSLPAYSVVDQHGTPIAPPCACPEMPQKHKSQLREEVTPVPTRMEVPHAQTYPLAHQENVGFRPIHLLRYPSYNPPPFDSDVPPPSLQMTDGFLSPPPKYETVVRDGVEPLADYFSRLAELDDSEEEDRQMQTRGGVRSMDERRPWSTGG